MVEHYPNDVSSADIVANYKYDIYGRRLQKNVNGTVTNFFWEGDNLSLELDENFQPIRRYVYGVGKDDVEGYVELSEVTGGMFNQYKQGWYSYIKDQVGTIYKVYSDYTQQMIDTRTYDVFGNMVNQNGSSNGNLGFQCKYYDQESELNYFYHRYYNPVNGRFINEDPIGFEGGNNFFAFVRNNPINGDDPFGLKVNCKRITEWKPATALEGPKNPGTLISEKIQNIYKLSFEIFSISRLFPFPKYTCIYHFLKRLKISTYKKKRLYEAYFECSNDECETYLERRYKDFLVTYRQVTRESYLGPEKLTKTFFHPCLKYITD